MLSAACSVALAANKANKANKANEANDVACGPAVLRSGQDMQKPRIVVIGAGAAGMAAACRLLEHGFADVLVLEAADRIGGRIHTTAFAGKPLDLGAQFCHGEQGNVVYELAKDLGLLRPWSFDYLNYSFLDADGSQVDDAAGRLLTDFYFNVIRDDDAVAATGNCSVGDYVTARFREALGTTLKHVDPALVKRFLAWAEKYQNCLDATPSWYDASAQAGYVACPGDYYLCWNRGYATLFDILSKKLPDPNKVLPIKDKIILNKPVLKVVSNHRGKEVKIECQDGSYFTCDHVIFTGSLGFLKARHHTFFEPSLPLQKITAIDSFGFGTVNKIFLHFEEKWWPDGSNGFVFFIDEEKSKELQRIFPYGPSADGKSWLEDILMFDTIDSDSSLLAWHLGKTATLVDELSDDIVVQGCHALLKSFLGNVPFPKTFARSKWSTDKWSCGSYSYDSMISHRSSRDILSQPLMFTRNNRQVPTVLFAGEATHPCYYSTVHGAVNTGHREADRLIQLYNGPRRKAHFDVAIVGAGMAGLAAAKTLVEGGRCSVVILEAQSAAGGRIRTAPFGGSHIDFGAQWIHKEESLLCQLATSRGLLTAERDCEKTGVYLRDDGFVFDQSLVKKVDSAVEEFMKDCEQLAAADHHPASFLDYLELRMDQYFDQHGLEEPLVGLVKNLLRWHELFQMIDNGCDDLSKLSAKHWGAFSDGNGLVYASCTNGMGSLVDAICADLPQGSLRLNHPVERIEWDSSGHGVAITCANGDSLHADNCIVTVPLGYLKAHHERIFSPRLPKEWQSYIANMGFGNVCKIFLLFEERWWDDASGFQLVSGTGRNDWTQYLQGFDAVSQSDLILMGWVGGAGVELVEGIAVDQLGRQCIDFLRKCLGRPTIPYPTEVERSTWAGNPWILGAYSHITTKFDNADWNGEFLSQPIGSLFFAGEATSPSEYSTVHGAWQTGVDRALYILQHR